MADDNQLTLLQRGVGVWNTWRVENPETHVDFSRADLSDFDLYGVNLSHASLSEATFRAADLREANLKGAYLNNAIFIDANLTAADLNRASLCRADLSGANLSGADLSHADLYYAYLDETKLARADFTKAEFNCTKLIDIDLRTVKGLETIVHNGPSNVGIDILYRSQGLIPESFLRKAGVPEDFLTYLPSLVNRAIEYYTCFISYSSKDQEFVESLYAHLQAKGVRCWFAPEDLKIGDKTRQRIHESIRLYDKLLLVLSKHSVASEWVEFEVETALEKERREKRTVLFPIRLDSAVKNSPTAWAAHIRNTRNIGNFSQWKDHDPYQTALKRLLRDLQPERSPQSQPS